jgi:putative chitinase
MELAKKYKTILDNAKINTSLRLAHFFAQLDHESGLKPIEENLNYSASGLIRVFRKYFNDLEAIQFQRQPERIANRVYANRMANGNENSGDGWKYRGRGFIQITGKENYSNLSKDTKIDYVANPDLLLRESDAMISAIWFWNKKGLNSFADKDDLFTITKRINGGLNGLVDRQNKLIKYKAIFK